MFVTTPTKLFLNLFLLCLSVSPLSAEDSESESISPVSIEPSLHTLSVEDTFAKDDSLGCFEDVDCDKGHRCSPSTLSCEPIDQCSFRMGRREGLKHGECILCKDDSDCGWQPDVVSPEDGHVVSKRLDYCWPDGLCREYPPFTLSVFKVSENADNNTTNPSLSIQDTRRFSKGDRVCVTVTPWFKEEAPHMKIDVDKLELCVSKHHFDGRIDKHGSSNPKYTNHVYQRAPETTYPGILPYDANRPAETGCATPGGHIRSYIVFSDKTGKDSGVGRADWLRVAKDDNHFHTSMEFGSITAGKDTVCFDAIPMTHEQVPIYMQLKVTLSSVDVVNVSKDHQKILDSIYGTADTGTWSGVVCSPKWKETRTATQPSSDAQLTQGYDGYHVEEEDDDDDDGLFVDCGIGTKFNGVAGLCESPSVSNQLYFWTLLGSTCVLIAGTIIFVIQLISHNKNLLHLVKTGHIDD